MRQKRITRLCCAGLLLVLVVMTVGCKTSQATPTTVSKSLGEIYTSQSFDTLYAGALNAYRQLMLGTIRLEGTDNAVTIEQAKTLLVLWQSLQGRALQSDAEREAVLAYIETQMTPVQLKAIAAMRLTQADLQAPTMTTRPSPSDRVTSQAGAGARGTSSGVGAASAQDTVWLNSLIRLLAQRAAEGAAPLGGNRISTRTPVPRALPSPTPIRP